MTEIFQAIKTLREGGVIVLPTDTVWGVACLLSSQKGIKSLYAIKHRPVDQPTGVFVKDLKMAKQLGVFSQQAEQLAKTYWPGSVSIVVPAMLAVPKTIMGKTKTVSLRVPKHQVVQQLIEYIDEPLVQTSANFAGKATPTTKEILDSKFTNLVDLIIGGESQGATASTIVEAVDTDLKILRQGDIFVKF